MSVLALVKVTVQRLLPAGPNDGFSTDVPLMGTLICLLLKEMVVAFRVTVT